MRKSFTWFFSLALLVLSFGFASVANAQCNLTAGNVSLVNPDVSSSCDGDYLTYQVTGFTAATGYHYEYAFNYDGNPSGGFTTNNKVDVPEGSTFKVLVRLVKDTDSSVSCESSELSVEAYDVTPLTLGTPETQQPKCNGDGGEITVNYTGGVGTHYFYVVPSTFNLANAATLSGSAYEHTTNQVVVGTGTYLVSVNNQAGCMDLTNSANWKTVTINAAPAALVVTPASTPLTCNNGSNGTVSVTVTGGTTPYSYSIDGTDFTNATGSFIGLSAGSYVVTVKDANGCTASSSTVTLANPAPIKFTIAVTDVDCAGAGNGAIAATIDASSPAGTYAVSVDNGITWVTDNDSNDGDLTSGVIKVGNLDPQYYSLLVKNTTTGCDPVAYVNPNGSGNVIAVQSPATIAYTVTHTTGFICNGSSTGSISISGVTGGSGTYEYALSTNGTWGAFGSTSSWTNLPAGTYNVSVQDKNVGGSCAIPYTAFDIEEADVVSITGVQTVAPTCYQGNDGLIKITATGGFGVYQYSLDGINWYDNNVFSAASGTYTVYVKDKNKDCGEVSNAQQTGVVVPALLANELSIVSSTESPLCNGAENGAITASIDSWTANRTVKLYYSTVASEVYNTGILVGTYNSNNSNTSIAISGLGDGSYYIWAVDNFGCKAQVADPVVITQNPPLAADAKVTTQAGCFGNNDGVLTVTANSEASGLQYGIANTLAALTNATYNAFPAGSNVVNIQLAAGIYYVKVKDACNNEVTDGPFEVKQYDLFQFSSNGVVIVDNVVCKGDENGSITLKPATGGSGNYEYVLSNEGGDLATQTTPIFTGLAAGTDYYVTATDDCGSIKVGPFTVKEPTEVTSTINKVQDITCNGSNDGVIQITATGGSAGTYEFQIGSTSWQAMPAAVSGVSTKNIVITAPGSYVIKVRDTNGCTVITHDAIAITEPAPVMVSLTAHDVTAPCAETANGSIDVKVTGGRTSEYDIFNGTTFVATTTDGEYTISNVEAGDYTITAKEVAGTVGFGCEGTASTHIGQPSTLAATSSVSASVSCHGGSDGAITVTVTGGTKPYTVQVGSATPIVGTATQSIFTFPALTAGIYSASVTDDVSCDYTTSNDTITEPDQLTVLATKLNDIGCNVKGKFEITATGGTPPYKYFASKSILPAHILVPEPTSTQWVTSNVFEVTDPATYIVWAMDANNCVVGGEDLNGNPVNEWRVKIASDVKAITFDKPTEIDPTCYGGKGSITVSNIKGGQDANYVVTINGTAVAQGTGEAAGTYTLPVVAGTYSVVVTDGVGDCSLSTQVTVKQPDPITVTLDKAQGEFTCPDVVEGYIEATATGGSGTYQYQLWRDGQKFVDFQGNNSFLVQINHTYAVKVIDSADCDTVASNDIVLDPVKPVTFTLSDKTCFDDQSASVLIKAAGEPGRAFSVQYRINNGAWGNWIPFDNDSTVMLTGLKFSNETAGQNFYDFQVRYTDFDCTYAMVDTSFVPTQHPLQVTMTQSADQLSADMTITGGISPYSYQVGDGEMVQLPANGNTFQVVKLMAPATDVTVYDAHGCIKTTTITVDPVTVTAAPATGTNMKVPFDVVLTFNREVTVAEGDIIGGTFTPGTGTTFTVTLTGEDLADVTLALGTGIVDAAGNHFAGETFTYTIGDNTAPLLVAKTPNGVTLTDNHPTFTMKFNENIVLGTGSLVVYKVGTSTAALTVPLNATTTSIADSVVTVTYVYDPTVGGLDKNTDYYVFVDNGAVKDTAGNAFAGVSDIAAWTFKTGPDFATSVPVNGSLEFKVYPNPFDGDVTVQNASKLSKIVVTNIAGQVVKQIVNPTDIIHLSELRSGVYFMSMYKSNNVVQTAKIVKR